MVPLKDFLKGFDLGKITADTNLEAMYRVYIASSTYQKLLNYSACNIVQPSHSLLHPSAYLFLVAYIANIMDPDQTVPM